MLEIKNLHKAFGANEVLKGIDFQVDKGEVVAILGPSGSGKTTLLRCISYLETADRGEMILDDQHFDMASISQKQIRMLRRDMGFVFQSLHLFRRI